MSEPTDPLRAIHAGRRLRERRERYGRTLEEARDTLKISVAHLDAIERGQLDRLPDGPVRDGFVRQYSGWVEALGPDASETLVPDADAPSAAAVDRPSVAEDDPSSHGIAEAEYRGDDDEAAPPEPPPSAIPLAAVRVIAIVSASALILLGSWQLWNQTLPAMEAKLPDAAPAAPSSPDQQVTISAERAAKLRVVVDGQVALDRQLSPGEKLDFVGRDRVEVDIPGAEAVKVVYNGETISPQGRQDEPRRLVFVDDLGR